MKIKQIYNWLSSWGLPSVLIAGGIFIALVLVDAADYTKEHTWVTGQRITASRLNDDIDGIIAVLNDLDNDNITSDAAIAYSKLDISASVTNSDIAASANIFASKIEDKFLRNDQSDSMAGVLTSQGLLLDSSDRDIASAAHPVSNAYVSSMDMGTNILDDTHLGYIKGWEHSTSNDKINGADLYTDSVDSQAYAAASIDQEHLNLTSITLASFTDDSDSITEGSTNIFFTTPRVDAQLDTTQSITSDWTFTQSVTADTVYADKLAVSGDYSLPIVTGVSDQALCVSSNTTETYWKTLASGHTQNTDIRIQDADGDTKIQAEESADGDIIRFDVEGTEAVSIDSTGIHAPSQTVTCDRVVLTSGNLALSSGAGVDFSLTGDQNGMTSELLDDYEKGTYTIAFTLQTSGSITLNSSFDLCSYTKIGRIVHVQGMIKIASVSSPTGDVYLSLPFACGTFSEYSERSTGSVSMSNVDFASTGWIVPQVIGDGNSTFYLMGSNDAGTPNVEEGGAFSAEDVITFQLTYFTD